jgi:hypothetical protein
MEFKLKKINFIPSDENVFSNTAPPLPSKSFIPKWYKDGELWISQDGSRVASSKESLKIAGMKTCVPFLDAMLSGYMIVSWHDLEIMKNDGDISYRYVEVIDNEIVELSQEKTISMIDKRPKALGHTIPAPAGHSKQHLVFKGQWGIQVPRGWSVMLTHPFNRFELPFTTVSGFMDSDGFWSNGNIPFYIKDGWTGIIPKGTPFAQIVPIKRKTWMGSVNLKKMKYSQKLGFKVAQIREEKGYGYYRDKIWVKKRYE